MIVVVVVGAVDYILYIILFQSAIATGQSVITLSLVYFFRSWGILFFRSFSLSLAGYSFFTRGYTLSLHIYIYIYQYIIIYIHIYYY